MVLIQLVTIIIQILTLCLLINYILVKMDIRHNQSGHLILYLSYVTNSQISKINNKRNGNCVYPHMGIYFKKI